MLQINVDPHQSLWIAHKKNNYLAKIPMWNDILIQSPSSLISRGRAMLRLPPNWEAVVDDISMGPQVRCFDWVLSTYLTYEFLYFLLFFYDPPIIDCDMLGRCHDRSKILFSLTKEYFWSRWVKLPQLISILKIRKLYLIMVLQTLEARLKFYHAIVNNFQILKQIRKCGFAKKERFSHMYVIFGIALG